ncbi:dienelactone hydrolase [Chamaesiphon sp. VAR_69_metabat_338]|uniref:alpha/beta hydrolase family protein n=1 Tax=Chamaesiphon sp. VAR_69_metabat_338 TaxID=2964704 RepID=UPI00286DEF7B|nr:dienelactone hydrolase [Chamaesiphon sp. VAR_69_metabat_338]
MSVRSLFQAVKVADAVAPYDTIQLKVFYPAQISDNVLEQSMGVIPADRQLAPFPIVIFFGGINCGGELYQWLAVTLAARGLVIVTFNWIAENLPGMVALTPGVDLKNLAPNTYGTAPTASALPALLAGLHQMNSSGVLAGLLDLGRVILGGHSAGGRAAIESANPSFYPQVVATFAYGAHTAAIVQLGYAPGTILPLDDRLPMLLIGGSCDGVIANSGDRYGVTWERPTTPIERTFQAIASERAARYLLLIEGANHFAIAHPIDTTIGTADLDFPATGSGVQMRDLISEAIGLFIEACVRLNSSSSKALDDLIDRAGYL